MTSLWTCCTGEEETAGPTTTGAGAGLHAADDAQVEALFAQVDAEAGRLDVLVNNVFAIPERVLSGQFPYDTKINESAEFTWRAVIALATERDAMSKTRKAFVVAAYGFSDVDGTTPPSLRPPAKPAAPAAK